MKNLPSTPAAGSPWAKGEVGEFLAQLQARAPARRAGRGRLIFALDATASREVSWDRACSIQGEMFEATAALGGLEIQLAFYRGFDETKHSGWVTSAAELHKLMRSVGCVGGHTQIERILTHALREAAKHPISALCLIGDAMEEKVDRLCDLASQLGSVGVPVFTFLEGADADADAAFRQMASLSRGAFLSFDLGSIDRLKQLLGGVAAYAAGGYRALESYSAGKTGEVLRLTSQLRIPGPGAGASS
jgi:hypothetical protein